MDSLGYLVCVRLFIYSRKSMNEHTNSPLTLLTRWFSDNVMLYGPYVPGTEPGEETPG